MNIKSNIKGLNEVLKKLKTTEEDIHNTIYDSMKKTMDIAKATAKMNAPVGQTGYLRENIFSKVDKSDSKITGQLYGNAEYNAYVEFGTGPKGRGTYPYKIKGYKLKYKGDKWKVKIPEIGVRWISGQKAQPHLGKAYQDMQKNFIKILKDNTQKYK